MELFKLMTKTDIVHVPYRATTAAMADLMGGRIDLVLIGLSSAKAQVEAGKLRALAIASPQRSPLMPDVPDDGGGGRAGLRGEVVVRHVRAGQDAAGHRRPIVARDQEGGRPTRNSSPRSRRSACRSSPASPDEMAQAMRADSKKWGDVIRGDRHHDQSVTPAPRQGIMIAPPFTAIDWPVM